MFRQRYVCVCLMFQFVFLFPDFFCGLVLNGWLVVQTRHHFRAPAQPSGLCNGWNLSLFSVRSFATVLVHEINRYTRPSTSANRTFGNCGLRVGVFWNISIANFKMSVFSITESRITINCLRLVY